MKSKLTIIASALFTILIFVETTTANLAGHGILSTVTNQLEFLGNSGTNYIDSQLDKIVWGQETNGVCVGLMQGNPQNNSLEAKNEMIGVYLKNNTTNDLRFVVPRIPFQFDLSVFTEQGTPVGRTEKGRDIGAPIPKLKRFTQEQMISNEFDAQTNAREFLDRNNVEIFTGINLLDYFNITKPGKYRVVYEQRFQTFSNDTIQSTNKLPLLVGLVWPKTAITIEVR